LSEVGRAPGRLKIGLMLQPGNGETSLPVMSDAANTVARQLISLGHHVEEARLTLGASWEAIVFANAQIWTATLVNWIEALAAASGRKISLDTLEPATMACYLYGKNAKAADFAAALDIRNQVTRAMGDWFGRYDILLTPTLPELPMAHGLYAAGADNMDGLEWTARLFRHSPFTPAFNMSGLPAMSMPLVQDAASGLPVGLQFGAGFAQESMLFRLAGQLEQAMPWIGRKPGIWAGALD
jgi:amidase